MSLILLSAAVKAVSWTVTVVRGFGVSSPQVSYVEFAADGRLITSAESGLLWYSAEVSAIGNNFDIYAELSSGPGGGATFDEWLSLSTLRRWELSSSVGIEEKEIVFTIRKASDMNVMHSAQIKLVSEVLA